MSKRAERRHHYQRLKKKVEYYYGGKFISGFTQYFPLDEEVLGCVVNTRPACSCMMCRNPRHSFYENKHTIQERKEFQDSIEYLIHEYYEEQDERV